MIIARQTWVVVADHSRASIFKNVGEIGEISPALIRTAGKHAERTHELGHDRPGRVHDGLGLNKSATEPTDLHAAVELKFLRAVLDDLAKDVQSGQCPELVMIAPPTAMGEIRQHMPHGLASKVVAQVTKDYTHLGINELQKTLMHLHE